MMDISKEIEAKLSVTESEFFKVMREIELDSIDVQMNYYYDTEDLKLASNGHTLRKRGRKFTLKLKESLVDGVRTAKEVSVPIDDSEFGPIFEFYRQDVIRQALGPILPLLADMGIYRVFQVGSLETLRHTGRLLLPSGGFCTVELDQSDIDYTERFFEIEIEDTSVEKINEAVAKIKQLAPGAKESPLSKYERLANSRRNR